MGTHEAHELHWSTTGTNLLCSTVVNFCLYVIFYVFRVKHVELMPRRRCITLRLRGQPQHLRLQGLMLRITATP